MRITLVAVSVLIAVELSCKGEKDEYVNDYLWVVTNNPHATSSRNEEEKRFTYVLGRTENTGCPGP